MSLLTVSNVSFAYEGQTALSEVNFEVNIGDYLCIIGENGAGKSTLMKGILGLKKPLTGNILTGEGIKSNEIGYLPQQTAIQKDFPASVFEVVLSGNLNALGLRPFYGVKEKKNTMEKMELLGITDLRKKCYKELSGGQQQRVLLARALCATKKLLFLDEPVTGLDPIMKASFYKLIQKLNTTEQITIVVVSHDMNGAIEYASHILHLGKKQLFFGTKDAYLVSDIGRKFVGGDSGDSND